MQPHERSAGSRSERGRWPRDGPRRLRRLSDLDGTPGPVSTPGSNRMTRRGPTSDAPFRTRSSCTGAERVTHSQPGPIGGVQSLLVENPSSAAHVAACGGEFWRTGGRCRPCASRSGTVGGTATIGGSWCSGLTGVRTFTRQAPHAVEQARCVRRSSDSGRWGVVVADRLSSPVRRGEPPRRAGIGSEDVRNRGTGRSERSPRRRRRPGEPGGANPAPHDGHLLSSSDPPGWSVCQSRPRVALDYAPDVTDAISLATGAVVERPRLVPVQVTDRIRTVFTVTSGVGLATRKSYVAIPNRDGWKLRLQRV
jgi:hypothetical protein